MPSYHHQQQHVAELTPAQLQEAALQAMQLQNPPPSRPSSTIAASLQQPGIRGVPAGPTVAQQLQTPFGQTFHPHGYQPSIQLSTSIPSPQQLQIQQLRAPITPAGLVHPPPLTAQEAVLKSLQNSPNLSPRPSGDFASSHLNLSRGSISPPGADGVLRADSWGVPSVGHHGSLQGNDVVHLFPFPAARYSISLDSMRGSAAGDDWFHAAAAAAREVNRGYGGVDVSDSAASMLQRVQISAQRFPKVI